MNKIILILLSSLLGNSIYVDVNMSNITNIDYSDISIKEEFFESTSSIGFNYEIFNFQNILIDIGLSYTNTPLSVKNSDYSFVLNSSFSPDDTEIYITNLYLKPSINLDQMLNVWIMIGLNHFNSSFIQINNDNFYKTDYNNGISYGFGLEYIMENGVYAGFNFIMNNSKANGKLHRFDYNNNNDYYETIRVDIDILIRSIRLGYYF